MRPERLGRPTEFGHVRGARRLAAEDRRRLPVALRTSVRARPGRAGTAARSASASRSALGTARTRARPVRRRSPAPGRRGRRGRRPCAREPHGRTRRRVLCRVVRRVPPRRPPVGRGVLGEVGGGAPHAGLDVGAGVEPFEDLVRELLGDPSPFVGRQPCPLVQQSRLRGVRLPLRHAAEHRAAQPRCPVCASSASTWTAATAATVVVSRSRTRRTSSRPRPSSRSVRISSSRATEAASYSR